jgi:hypothetical protein
LIEGFLKVGDLLLLFLAEDGGFVGLGEVRFDQVKEEAIALTEPFPMAI